MKKDYKAAISGAHSQGKTTLVNSLKQDPFLVGECNFSFRTNLTRDLKKLNIPINENGTDMTQYLVMARHLEFALAPGNWLLDRCALDGIAYTEYFYNKGIVHPYIRDAAIQIYSECVERYDRIFYVVPELPLVEDNTRSTNKEFFDGVVSQFNTYIKHVPTIANKLKYVMGTQAERTATVIETIKSDFQNE